MVLLLSSIPRTRNILHAFVLLLVLFSLTRLVTLPTKFPAGNNDPVYEIYKPIQRQRQNNQQLNNNNNNNHSESSSNNHMVQHRPAASYSALKEQQVALKVTIENNNEGNNNNNNNTIIHNNDNPYEGWQPIINNTEQDDSGNKECNSWRTCFSKTHICPAKCRDSLQDFGTAPQRPGFVPNHPYNGSSLEDNPEKAAAQASVVEWIPDVTVLRRMLKAGKDEHGNPWPPPLVTETDRELCEEIGDSGERKNDQNSILLNAVPIRGMPLLLESPSLFETKKMKRQPRILCMVYTMEVNHHTSIRAIRETWAPGCDGFLAFSTKDDPRIPAISLPHDGKEEYKNMVRTSTSTSTL